eukprot:5523074-Amphidinium_carterae.1
MHLAKQPQIGTRNFSLANFCARWIASCKEHRPLAPARPAGCSTSTILTLGLHHCLLRFLGILTPYELVHPMFKTALWMQPETNSSCMAVCSEKCELYNHPAADHIACHTTRPRTHAQSRTRTRTHATHTHTHTHADAQTRRRADVQTHAHSRKPVHTFSFELW